MHAIDPTVNLIKANLEFVKLYKEERFYASNDFNWFSFLKKDGFTKNGENIKLRFHGNT